MADQRVDRSRTALKQALFKLLLTRPYAGITIEDIAQCAGVARSTFYVHFKDKDALLGSSVSDRAEVLGQLAQEDPPVPALATALEHFVWAGDAAVALLTTDVYPLVAATLAGRMEHHLRARGLHRPGRLLVSSAILSAMLAEATFAGIRVWLTSGRRATAEDFARALTRQVGAMIAASIAGTAWTQATALSDTVSTNAASTDS